MEITTDSFWLVSKTQNVRRLKSQKYIVHFPETSQRAICHKYSEHWRHLPARTWSEDHDRMNFCEDCLTVAGEH